MTNDERDDRGVFKRRPFLYEVPEKQVADILNAYDKVDDLLFFKRKDSTKRKKKLF